MIGKYIEIFMESISILILLTSSNDDNITDEDGIEPSTLRLTVARTTNCATHPHWSRRMFFQE